MRDPQLGTAERLDEATVLGDLPLALGEWLAAGVPACGPPAPVCL